MTAVRRSCHRTQSCQSTARNWTETYALENHQWEVPQHCPGCCTEFIVPGVGQQCRHSAWLGVSSTAFCSCGVPLSALESKPLKQGLQALSPLPHHERMPMAAPSPALLGLEGKEAHVLQSYLQQCRILRHFFYPIPAFFLCRLCPMSCFRRHAVSTKLSGGSKPVTCWSSMELPACQDGLLSGILHFAEINFCSNETQSKFNNIPLLSCRNFMLKSPILKRHLGRQAVN